MICHSTRPSSVVLRESPEAVREFPSELGIARTTDCFLCSILSNIYICGLSLSNIIIVVYRLHWWKVTSKMDLTLCPSKDEAWRYYWQYGGITDNTAMDEGYFEELFDEWVGDQFLISI
jgi:hypothetical protein